ncbi:unnamed protein product, partial [Cylicostephanus goldi]
FYSSVVIFLSHTRQLRSYQARKESLTQPIPLICGIDSGSQFLQSLVAVINRSDPSLAVGFKKYLLLAGSSPPVQVSCFHVAYQQHGIKRSSFVREG